MIIVISNRNINPNQRDENTFGEKPNERGIDELRVATASYNSTSKRWTVELEPEPNPNDLENPPSRVLFNRVMTEIDAGKLSRDWVFYIHGFNTSFKGSLETAWLLQEKYKVNVIVFSWPSNQGGSIRNEYRDAREAAKVSSTAIDRALEKLGRYLSERGAAMLERHYELRRSADSTASVPGCQISLNLLMHSLGNYLFECFVKIPIFNGETRIFDNVVLHQADVDNKTHIEWVNKISSKRIYITLNERDSALKASNYVNSPRLGNTAENLKARRALYVDFTGARNVSDSHDLFLGVQNNNTVTQFCQQVLTGGRGETVEGFRYDARTNTFVVRN